MTLLLTVQIFISKSGLPRAVLDSRAHGDHQQLKYLEGKLEDKRFCNGLFKYGYKVRPPDPGYLFGLLTWVQLMLADNKICDELGVAKRFYNIGEKKHIPTPLENRTQLIAELYRFARCNWFLRRFYRLATAMKVDVSRGKQPSCTRIL